MAYFHIHLWTSLKVEVFLLSLPPELRAIAAEKNIWFLRSKFWPKICSEAMWTCLRLYLFPHVTAEFRFVFIVPPAISIDPSSKSSYGISRHFPVLNLIHWTILGGVIGCRMVSNSIRECLKNLKFTMGSVSWFCSDKGIIRFRLCKLFCLARRKGNIIEIFQEGLEDLAGLQWMSHKNLEIYENFIVGCL